MRLPEAFENRMKRMLGDEYAMFRQSFEQPSYRALRVNTLKIAPEDLCSLSGWELEKVPWTKNGYYYTDDLRPGKHPYHDAGLYYIQEPSAMAVAEVADAKPGEWVLDLCAAPGGKSTQLAAQLRGEGVLVANEIHPVRAKILSQNIERMGIRNAIVTNEKPEQLATHFLQAFDRIIVDAPCSGEGMFRRDETAREQWSEENVRLCAARQLNILSEADRMLKKSGTLVYSTCTFAPQENEQVIAAFLAEHRDYEIQPCDPDHRFESGRNEWAESGTDVSDTCRLWPHRLHGEGHYVALLHKTGTDGRIERNPAKCKAVSRDVRTLWDSFAKDNLTEPFAGDLTLFGDQLYLLPQQMNLDKIKVLRAGLHLGTVKKDRIEPSHALAMTLTDAVRVHTRHCSDEEVTRYLRGEAIPCEGENGWTLLLCDGYPLGWGKVSSRIMKNHYPKGLRRF